MAGCLPPSVALGAPTHDLTSSSAAALDSLAMSLAAASAERVARAVALVDALPTRGAADGLIAAVRPRLAKLRPARRIGFARLLFTPLDAVVVPLDAWSRGSPGIPRPALAALTRAIRDGWTANGDASLDSLDQRLRSLPATDRPRLLEVGAPLWAHAAIVLRRVVPPTDWRRGSGLPHDDFRPLACAVAMVLAHAETVVGDGVRHSSQTRLDAVLLPVCRSALAMQAGFSAASPKTAPNLAGPDATPVATLLAALMTAATRGDRVLAMFEEAATGNKPATRAGRLAVDFVLDDALREVGRAPFPHLLQLVGRTAGLVKGLNALMQFRPAGRQRLIEVSAALDCACRTRFATALKEAVGQAHPDLLAQQRFEQLEDARALAAVASAFGDPAAYVSALREALERLGNTGTLGLTDEELLRLRDRLVAPLSLPVTPST